jgi:hypothetical protein
MNVYLGKDPYYKAFNGELRGFKFAVGTGAYRNENFDELYN